MKMLFAWVNIQPGEGQVFNLMYWHYFMLGVAFHFTQTAAFAIFLANFSAQDLPYTYIINAITITLLVAAYLKLSRSYPFATMLSVNVGFLLALTILFALGVPASNSLLLFLLPTLFEVTVQLGNLEYWSLAGRLFDLRQSKRLFGLVGSGNWIATILGGLLTPSLVALFGTANLLWLSVVGLVITLGLLLFTTRLFAPQLSATDSFVDTTPGQVDEQDNPLKSRYAVLIFCLVSLWWLAFYFVDNIFFIRTAERFSEADQFASFLGIFYSIFGVVALLVSVVFTGPVLGRFGVRLSIRVLPVILLAGSGLMVVLGLVPGLFLVLFWITAASKLLDMALGFTLDRTTLNILYQPLSPSRRVRVKTTAEGIFVPLAIGLAGIALLFFNRLLGFNVLQMSVMLLCIVTGWTIIAVLVGREYLVMLLKAITRRRISGIDLPLEDASSRMVLQQALQNPRPEVALFALQQLMAGGQETGQLTIDEISTLLDHPAPEVRHEVMRWLQIFEPEIALPLLREHLKGETAVGVQAAIVTALANLGNGDVPDEVYGYLESPELQLQAAAMIALLSRFPAEVAVMAEGRLSQLVRSTNPAERIMAARIIGQVKAHNLSQLLARLLRDEASEVRRAGLTAAGQAGFSELWPDVIQGLSQRGTQSAAVLALSAAGDQALETIAAMYPKSNRDVQLRLLSVCGRIGSPSAVEFLLQLLNVADDGLRGQVVNALLACQYQPEAAERMMIQQQLDHEAKFAAWLLGHLAALPDLPDPAWELLRQALWSRFRQTQDRILTLLSFFGQPGIFRARENLRATSPEKRAYALEIIELALPAAQKPHLLPFLEPLPVVDRLAQWQLAHNGHGSTVTECLVELITGSHPWTAACAIFSVPLLQQELPKLADAVKLCLTADNPLLVETANRTLRRIS